jgi:peptidyl-prolyl cis-trans isomerase D
MLDAIRRRKRIAQIILLILIIPFAFFGVERYFSTGPSRNEVATVGDSAVTVAALRDALQRQSDRLRTQMGEAFDPKLVRSQAFVQEVLRQLLERQILLNEAQRLGLQVPQTVVQKTLAAIPAFQKDGRFDFATYEAALRAQGMTPARFEALVQEDLAIEKLLRSVRAAVVPPQNVLTLLRWQEEARRVRWQRHSIDAVAATLPVDEQAVEAFFQQHQDRFQKPDEAVLEYVVLDEKQLEVPPVPEEDVRKAFETRKAAIAQPEKRRIRHILITASNPDDGKTPPEEVTELFAQLRGKDEAQFAEIAKNRSEDAATRGQGGDLGWVTKEELPLALAEAVFAAKTPGLLDPVRTDFGWHLVWLSAIQPAQTPTFDAVAPQIRAALQQEARKRRFTELAAELPNLAFDAVDRLDPVAEKIGVPIEKTPLMPLDALTLNDGTPLPAALMAQLKSENARRGENLDPVTLPDGRMVVVRVAPFEPARPRTFAEAKADAIAAWRRDRAQSQLVDSLTQQVETNASITKWDGEKRLQRNDTTLPRTVVEAAFALPRKPGVRKVVTSGDAVWLLELVAVETLAVTENDARVKSLATQLHSLYGDVHYRAWLRTVEARYPIQIRQEALREFTAE